MQTKHDCAFTQQIYFVLLNRQGVTLWQDSLKQDYQCIIRVENIVEYWSTAWWCLWLFDSCMSSLGGKNLLCAFGPWIWIQSETPDESL